MPIVGDEPEPNIEEDDDDPDLDLSHVQVLDIFKARFPDMDIKQWWKKGPNAIRVRINEILQDTDVVFKYSGSDRWRLETLRLYNRRNKVR